MPKHPALHTERLLLRPLTVNDAVPLFEAFGDPETMWFFGDVHDSVAETESVFEYFVTGPSARNSRQWAICLKTERVIGSLSINGIVNRSARIGFILIGRHQGRGYMPEALGAVLDYVFGPPLDLHRVTLHIDPDNRPSQRVAEKLGFTLEGQLRESFPIRAMWRDELVYGLLRREWLHDNELSELSG